MRLAWTAVVRRFGLAEWAGLLLRLGIAVVLVEVGTRGLLALKDYIERDLPDCYDYVTVRCRTPEYMAELEDVIQFDLLIGAGHAPNYRGRWMTTNAQGFRGMTDYGAKTPGVLRVVVVGGSAAWGTFVHDDETMPAYLQTALAEGLNRPVEVINAAVTSATSFQELVRLEADVMPLKPDVVIAFGGRNDVYYGNSPLWSATRTPAVRGYEAFVRRSAEADPEALWDLTLRAGLRYSVFLRTVDAISRGWSIRRQAGLPLEMNPESVTAYQRNLRWMAAVLKAEGIVPVFVLQPILQHGAKTLAIEEEMILDRAGPAQNGVESLYPQARAAMAALGESDPAILALDYTDLFVGMHEQLYFDPVHYFAEGNRLIARQLAADMAHDLDTE